MPVRSFKRRSGFDVDRGGTYNRGCFEVVALV